MIELTKGDRTIELDEKDSSRRRVLERSGWRPVRKAKVEVDEKKPEVKADEKKSETKVEEKKVEKA